MGKADDRNAKGQLNELAFLKMAGAAGLEPATIGFGDRCSTNWNYAPATNEANYTKPGSKVKAFFLTFDAIEQFTSKSRQFPQPAGVTCCICSPAGVGMGPKWGKGETSNREVAHAQLPTASTTCAPQLPG
jgi:hypothetical protein